MDAEDESGGADQAWQAAAIKQNAIVDEVFINSSAYCGTVIGNTARLKFPRRAP
jgi:hypothetical protein